MSRNSCLRMHCLRFDSHMSQLCPYQAGVAFAQCFGRHDLYTFGLDQLRVSASKLSIFFFGLTVSSLVSRAFCKTARESVGDVLDCVGQSHQRLARPFFFWHCCRRPMKCEFTHLL